MPVTMPQVPNKDNADATYVIASLPSMDEAKYSGSVY